jgi:MYXO-CTERM domain-containing protein
MLAVASDPTGLSSPFGKLVMIAGLLAVLVLLVLAWRRKR